MQAQLLSLAVSSSLSLHHWQSSFYASEHSKGRYLVLGKGTASKVGQWKVPLQQEGAVRGMKVNIVSVLSSISAFLT